LADKGQDILGQPVIIENKPGANGAIGADYVAKSTPDGTTLFLTTLALSVSRRTGGPISAMTHQGFAPITLVVLNTTLIVVKADRRHSMKDLTARAKSQKPEK